LTAVNLTTFSAYQSLAIQQIAFFI